MIGLVRLAAPIAFAGLAVLLLARTRTYRIAGLGYTAVGVALFVAALPSPGAAQLAVAIGGFLVLGWALSLAFRREPWLVAYLALATVPVSVVMLVTVTHLPPVGTVVAVAGVSTLMVSNDCRDGNGYWQRSASSPRRLY